MGRWGFWWLMGWWWLMVMSQRWMKLDAQHEVKWKAVIASSHISHELIFMAKEPVLRKWSLLFVFKFCILREVQCNFPNWFAGIYVLLSVWQLSVQSCQLFFSPQEITFIILYLTFIFRCCNVTGQTESNQCHLSGSPCQQEQAWTSCRNQRWLSWVHCMAYR